MFSHDGVKDSLTRLAAPPRFYEELHREIARSNRSGERLSLIRLSLVPEMILQGEDREGSESRYSLVLLNFSETLTRVCRSEDLLVRIGECEFVTLIRGGESVAVRVIERVAAEWLTENEAITRESGTQYLEFTSAYVTARTHENSLELLNRLDLQPLISRGG